MMIFSFPPESSKKRKARQRKDIAKRNYIKALNEKPTITRALVSPWGQPANSKWVTYEEATALCSSGGNMVVDYSHSNHEIAKFFYYGWLRKAGGQRDF